MNASVTGATLIVIGLVAIVAALISFGLWVGRAWLRRHPHAQPGRHITTPTGLVLYGFQTLLLFVGLVARQLQIFGEFGKFLNTSGGLIAYFVALIVGSSIVAAVLAKLGRPVSREPGEHDV